MLALAPGLLVAALVAAAPAQNGFGQFRLPEGVGSYPPRYPPSHFEDGSFMICKLQYTSVRYEAMGSAAVFEKKTLLFTATLLAVRTRRPPVSP